MLPVDTFTGPGALDEIHRAFAVFWAEHPEIADRVRADLELAAAEIAANIIEHSAAGGTARLRMSLDLGAGEIRATFHDDGTAAGVDLASVQMPGALAECGRGQVTIRGR